MVCICINHNGNIATVGKRSGVSSQDLKQNEEGIFMEGVMKKLLFGHKTMCQTIFYFIGGRFGDGNHIRILS